MSSPLYFSTGIPSPSLNTVISPVSREYVTRIFRTRIVFESLDSLVRVYWSMAFTTISSKILNSPGTNETLPFFILPDVLSKYQISSVVFSVEPT